MASGWCAIPGYNHPALNRAISDQFADTAQLMPGDLNHDPAAKLARMLVDLTPAGLDRVFFSDSGSLAVEAALKIALHYWCSRDKPEKQKLVALRNAYHGDTFGAMSLSDPATGVHQPFADVLPRHHFAPAPKPGFDQPCQDSDLAAMADLLDQHHREIAAVIVEPIVQAAGGMRFYSPDYLVRLRALCDAFDVILIFDEIASGFGRTGKLFALQHAGVEPDILCLGKALTGGYMTLAATLCSESINSAVNQGDTSPLLPERNLSGNPLACASAIASIELLLSQPWQRMVQGLEQALAAGLAPAAELEQVADVRTLGGIGVIELREPVVPGAVQSMFLERGVWVRPYGKLVYAMPPYIMNAQDLASLTTAMVDVVRQL